MIGYEDSKDSIAKKFSGVDLNNKSNLCYERVLKDCADYHWLDSSTEPFANLDYEDEREIKNRAFCRFLKLNGIRIDAQEIAPSPLPRHYRTTTKRRVVLSSKGVSLGFSNAVEPGKVAKSELELEEHQGIYEWLKNTLSSKSFFALANALNWLIIRGSRGRPFLIFNIFQMNASVVRKLKQISDLLQKEKIVVGALSYFDPTRSDYYLEAEKPRGLQIKHLFGQKLLGLKVGDILMRYSPTGFSQVNESMVPEMVELAKKMLKPQKDDHLLDLYCGYGLFSHTLGQQCQKVTGVELSADAIASAREISKRLKASNRMQFYDQMIDARFVREKLSRPQKAELILLDPPRKGCEPGVIAELAKRQPKRVLQIFCGTDVIPKEIKEWHKAGYKAKMIQPIDMFAGTANLETMVLFEK